MKELIKCSGGMAGIAGDQASMLHWKRCTTQKPHWEGGREGGMEGRSGFRNQRQVTVYCAYYRALVYHCTVQNYCLMTGNNSIFQLEFATLSQSMHISNVCY